MILTAGERSGYENREFGGGPVKSAATRGALRGLREGGAIFVVLSLDSLQLLMY